MTRTPTSVFSKSRGNLYVHLSGIMDCILLEGPSNSGAEG